MSETLCELTKLLKKHPADYLALVEPPKFICLECGRVAQKKKNLCEPEKIKTLQEKLG